MTFDYLKIYSNGWIFLYFCVHVLVTETFGMNEHRRVALGETNCVPFFCVLFFSFIFEFEADSLHFSGSTSAVAPGSFEDVQ